MTLLLATRNEGKIREFQELLAGAGIEVETLDAQPDAGEVEETGETFEENARIKATHYARATGRWTVAEDSGLVVDSLGGEPGVHSARYAGTHGDDAANNRKLLSALEGVEDRGARYVCSIVLAQPSGDVAVTVQGVCEGRIVQKPRGKGGFGYDPLFVPGGEFRTNAELPPEEKNSISHRGRALRSFLPLLRVQLPSLASSG
ncbi:MAG: XTP/dITP diphosphatase [Proteobacteria bacterium]|nr:XTP/dITP diphosphatase [Pseudomonadota bacterium]